MVVSKKSLVEAYFQAWNAHDQAAVEALHASASTLTDWDGTRKLLLSEISTSTLTDWDGNYSKTFIIIK
jgi:hypothetical protein